MDAQMPGMDDFLAKPFHPEALFETLLTWLLQRRPRSV